MEQCESKPPNPRQSNLQPVEWLSLEGIGALSALLRASYF